MFRLERIHFVATLKRFEDAIDKRRFGGVVQLSGQKLADEKLCTELERTVNSALESRRPEDRLRLMKIVYQLAMAETIEPRFGIDNKNRMMELLTKTYCSIEPDPAYMQHMRQGRRKFQEYLLKDRAFLSIREQGSIDDPDNSIYYLTHLMQVHNKAMEHPTLEFRTSRLLFNYTGGEGAYSTGDIKFAGDVVDRVYGFMRRNRILVHENTHAQQDQMGQAYREGRLTPASPFYWQGMIHAEFDQEDGKRLFYVLPKENRTAYYVQPVEREAYTAERVFAVVEKRLKYEEAIREGRNPSKIKRLAGRPLDNRRAHIAHEPAAA
jgi:hypothetical protein